MQTQQIIVLVLVLLALVHIFAGKLTFIATKPRSRWLSFAGGTSVAYVFLHIIPELAFMQEHIRDELGDTQAWLEHHIYLLSLLGLIIFFGLEQWMNQVKNKHEKANNAQNIENTDFYLHLGVFCLYNLLIGYLLLYTSHQDTLSFLLFGLAMVFHFLVNDYGLKQRHEHLYKSHIRWLLASAVIIGFLLGNSFAYQQFIAHLIYGFLAGTVILNVLKEELPNERESKFFPFLLGVVSYGALLLLI